MILIQIIFGILTENFEIFLKDGLVKECILEYVRQKDL